LKEPGIFEVREISGNVKSQTKEETEENYVMSFMTYLKRASTEMRMEFVTVTGKHSIRLELQLHFNY